ncbi:MAG TPA: phage baseplate assembly protein V [Bacteroidota bacterium]|nr:phage baseplate assembly protein V [Bacteroidota bacterium]
MATGLPNLKIGGDKVRNELADAILLSVEVNEELNEHYTCKLICRRSDQNPNERMYPEKLLSEALVITGVDHEGNEIVVFRGIIIDVELTYEISGSYQTQLTAITASYFMDLTPRCKRYDSKEFTDIAKQLANKAEIGDEKGTKVQISGSDTRSYTQWGESDWEFLARIVDDHEAWMRPNGYTGVEIYDSFQSGSKLAWREEHGLISFKAKGTLTPQTFAGACYNPWEMKSQVFQEVKDDPQYFDGADALMIMLACAKDGLSLMPSGYLYEPQRLAPEPVLQAYEDLLKKESRRSVGAGVNASGESMNPKLQPGDTVDISGLPDSNGTYGLTKVIHRWTPTGYLNEFACTPWKKYTNPKPPVPRTWPGLVSGRVTDNNDPNAFGRIKVQFVWQDETMEVWARMISPHAGADRGFMFFPEVGDEVVIGFHDGNVERPYVIGCVWNGVDKPPREDFWGGDTGANDVKRIVTKSGHRIQIADKQGKESIVLATPKELKVSLIEKTDETGRSMITLHSENGDIFLNAPNGRVHIRGKFVSDEAGQS